MTLHLNLAENSYDVVVERGALAKVGELFHLNRRVLVVTDRGVPCEYAARVLAACKEGVLCTVEEGEGSKSFSVLEKLLSELLSRGFSRRDCVVAVGGGVVGDLCGFAASTYMRGIDFYNVPTTLLSQIDSSIGGKTAINFGGVKNVVGAFYQPKKVLIDPDLLKTLPARQVSNGLAEAVKMALTSDRELFELLENGDIRENMDEIILRSLTVKKQVVEQDEKEAGLRKVLNFGHTFGHAVETTAEGLYHGECVALGMIPMCETAVRQRLLRVLKKCNLFKDVQYDWEKIASVLSHDKKADGACVDVITVSEIGTFERREMAVSDVVALAKVCLKG